VKELPVICEYVGKYSSSFAKGQELLDVLFAIPFRDFATDFQKFVEMMDTTLDFEMVCDRLIV